MTSDIRDYGAVLDGTTDNTAAFASAMASVGTVYIPTGTCVLENAAILSNGRVYGDGIDLTILKLKAGSAQNRAVLRNADQAGGNSNITIEELTVDGNHTNQTNDLDGQNVYGIFLQNVDTFTLTNVKAIEAVNHCVMLSKCHNGTLTTCEGNSSSKDSGLEINGGGVANGAYNVTFATCTAHDNFESGIEFDAGSWNCAGTNCTSYDNGMHGIEIEHHYVGLDLIAETKLITITGGEVYGNDDEGVFVKGKNVTINGIHSHHNTLNGIVFRQDGDNGSVINSECNNNSQYGILVSGAIGCTQSGNNAHDNTLGDIQGF